MPTADPATIGEWAKLIDQYGALIILAIMSVAFNMAIISMIVMGKLVPYRIYKKALDEADRLQQTMEKERSAYLTKFLAFTDRMKANPKEDESRDSNKKPRKSQR